MKVTSLLLVGFLMIFTACSNSSKVEEGGLKEGNEVNEFDDSVALTDENEYESDESINEDEYTDDTIEEAPEEEVAETDAIEEETNEEVVEDEPTEVAANTFDQAPESPQVGTEMMDYEVQENDTLMMIAFKTYGDYSQWRKILEANPELESSTGLQAGKTIKLYKPVTEFVWTPEGESYLIKKDETLSTISETVYETPNRWYQLYQHNKPLIKNPNVIFAGFTIYYLPAEEMNRYPASWKK